MKQILFGLAVTTVTTLLMRALILSSQQKNLDRIEDGMYSLNEKIELSEERNTDPISLSVPLAAKKTIEAVSEEPVEGIDLTLNQPKMTYLGTFEVTAYCPCPK